MAVAESSLWHVADSVHKRGNVDCPSCEYTPRAHICGGLIHSEYTGEKDDLSANIALKCDGCNEVLSD